MKKITSVLFMVSLFLSSVSLSAQELIISEVVDATLPGGLPKFVELTNIGDVPIDLSEFSIGNFSNGGTTLGGGTSTVLSGSLAPSESYVISYENGDGPGSGSFFNTYGFDLDNFDLGSFINGDDVIALFQGPATGDGSDATLIDLYGVIGVNGDDEVWDYTDGFGVRNTNVTSPNASFTPAEWSFGAANSLETGDDVTELALILANTTPGTFGDIAPLGTTLSIAADNAVRAEGDTGTTDFTFIVTRSGDVVGTTNVDFGVTGDVDASDFGGTLPSGTLSFMPEQTSQTITVSVSGDTEDESDEMFTVTLSNATNGATIQTASADGIVQNDDSPGGAVSIVINEILFDPAPDLPGDANGDGTRDGSEDEFIELVNMGADPLDISGWTISDLVQVRHTFPTNTILNPMQAIVVFGGGTPVGSFSGAVVQTASGGFLGLNNGGDTVTLNNGTADIAMEAYSNTIADESTTRDPDLTGSFIGHSSASSSGGALFSPGTRIDGTPFSGNSIPLPSLVFNELRISSSGASDDDSNYLEIFGNPNVSLDGLSLVAISGEFAPGQVDFVFDLTGFSTDANGFFLLANPTITSAIPQAELEGTDVTSDFDFFGSPSSFLIVSGFTAPQGTDLDSNDDGIFDSDIGMVIDAVSLVDGDANTDVNYGTLILGPDSNGFPPAGIARDIDGTGSYVQLVFNDLSADTPGFTNVPDVVEPGEITEIYTIQGEGHTSPLLNNTVTTTGIVTVVDTNGFYLQDPLGDDNIATSDAIFVFTGGAPTVTVGDELQVTGTVDEFFPGGVGSRNLSTTQISNPSISTTNAGVALPVAQIIGSSGRVPPTQNIDDDAFGAFEPTTDGIDFFESMEAMLVTAEDVVAIAPTNGFGEIFTVVNQGLGASVISERGTLNISPDDFNPEKIQIDEDTGILDFDLPLVNVGATLGNVTGVMGYSFGNFEILPTVDFSANVQNPTLNPETTSLVGTADQLTITSYNVLNLDPNDADGDTDVADGRFTSIAMHIVNNLMTPDIIGLQEVQDNNGSTDDGTTAANNTLQALVDAIVLAGGIAYEFIDNTLITNNQSGGQPGGNIRTAFLYNPNRVALVDGSVRAVGGQGSGEAFNGARLPLVATFLFNGQQVTIVNNHFSSKGGSAPILGVEQDFASRQEDVTVNGSLDERRAQSQAVQDFVDAILTTDVDANIVVLGDLNEFEFISPVLDLETDSGLVNLTNNVNVNERYSFIFQGNSQQLDHILISSSLNNNPEVDIVHVNSEFPDTDSKASDHDPVVALLTLGNTTA
ncbi:MAG: lamin tail domain-containing protein, partial [Bacteroidota bacterium]